MRQSWMRKIYLFSIVVGIMAGCTKPEYSEDLPLIPEQQNNLYVVSQGNMLYALNPKTGAVNWQFFQKDGFNAEPFAMGEHVFVNAPNCVLKLSAKDGSFVDSIYKDNTPSGALNGTGDYLFIPIGNTPNNSKTVKVNHVTNELQAWEVPIINSNGTSPIIFGNQILLAGNMTPGMRLESIENAANTAWILSSFSTSSNPTTDGVSIFATTGSLLQAYDFLTGQPTWSYNTPTVEEISTSPILYGGNILFGCIDNNLYCIDSIAQDARWVFNSDERIFSSPYAYEQTVYFGSNDHYLYAVNISDGTMKWRYRTGAIVRSSPIAYDGMVYVGSYDQHIYAFDTSGALKWKFRMNGLSELTPVIHDAQDDKKSVYSAVSGLSSQ